MSTTLAIADAFPALQGGAYHPHLAELRSYEASGVYAIVSRKGGRVLYIGESHTGRLYDTITRHFRAWGVPAKIDGSGRRQGGTQYDRTKARIVYLITPKDEAIARHVPRDNTIDGMAEAPF